MWSRSTEWNLRWLNHWIGFTITFDDYLYICQSRSIHTRHRKDDGMDGTAPHHTVEQTFIASSGYLCMALPVAPPSWAHLYLRYYIHCNELCTLRMRLKGSSASSLWWAVWDNCYRHHNKKNCNGCFYSPPWWSSVPAPDSKHTLIWYISVMDEILCCLLLTCYGARQSGGG